MRQIGRALGEQVVIDAGQFCVDVWRRSFGGFEAQILRLLVVSHHFEHEVERRNMAGGFGLIPLSP